MILFSLSSLSEEASTFFFCNETEKLGGILVKGSFTEDFGGEMVEDREIVDLYWQRDKAALTETEKKYGRYCRVIAMNILSNKEDADESVNDAWLNAWNSMPPHRPEALGAFLGKLTRCVCLKKWRDMRAQKRGSGAAALVYEELSDCIADQNDISAELEAKELAKVIDSFLREIPDVQRKIFICRYWYFDSIRTISAQSGFSESKVKSILFRVRARLRKRLEKEGIAVER